MSNSRSLVPLTIATELLTTSSSMADVVSKVTLPLRACVLPSQLAVAVMEPRNSARVAARVFYCLQSMDKYIGKTMNAVHIPVVVKM
jgi:hypothetical protein